MKGRILAQYLYLYVLCLSFPAFTEATTTSCLHPPSSLVGWWPGDNSANDIVGSNNGFFNGSYITGEVEAAFGIQGTGNHFVIVLRNSAFETQHITVDAWVKADGSPGDFKYIIDKGASRHSCSGKASYALYTGANGGIRFYISSENAIAISPDF